MEKLIQSQELDRKAGYECKALEAVCRSVRILFPFLALTLLVTACVAPRTYTPAIVAHGTHQVEQTNSNPIPLKVRLAKVVDISPIEDKEDGWLYGRGWSVTSPNR